MIAPLTDSTLFGDPPRTLLGCRFGTILHGMSWSNAGAWTQGADEFPKDDDRRRVFTP